MVQAQLFRGTWEEIMNYARAFKGWKNLMLIVPMEEVETNPTVKEHFYLTATPEEFQKAFDALGKGHENQPILPSEAFDRENLNDEYRF